MTISIAISMNSERQQSSERVRQHHRIEGQVAGEGGGGGEAGDAGRLTGPEPREASCQSAEVGRAERAIVNAAELGSGQCRLAIEGACPGALNGGGGVGVGGGSDRGGDGGQR